MIETELPCLTGMSGLVLLEAVRVGYEICTLQLDDPCFGGPLLSQPGAANQTVFPGANVSGDKSGCLSAQWSLLVCSLYSRLFAVSLEGSWSMLSSQHLIATCSALKLQICDGAAGVLTGESADSGYGSNAASTTPHEEPSHKPVCSTCSDSRAACFGSHFAGVSGARSC